MAWLVCVRRDDREPYQYINDLISIYEDGQSFPDHYPDTFIMLQVNGTKADVKVVLDLIKPQVVECFRPIAGGTWSFIPPDEDWENKKVWRPANTSVRKWYNLVNDFKFYINIGSLTPEEKQLLQTYDITHASIASFINKICKDISEDPVNNVEETDLKNQTP